MYNIFITHIVQRTLYAFIVWKFCWTQQLLKRKWLSRENVFRMALVDGQRNFRSHYYEKVKLNRRWLLVILFFRLGFEVLKRRSH